MIFTWEEVNPDNLRQQRSRQTRVHQTHTTKPFLLRATSSHVFLSLSLRSRQFCSLCCGNLARGRKVTATVRDPVALNQLVSYSVMIRMVCYIMCWFFIFLRGQRSEEEGRTPYNTNSTPPTAPRGQHMYLVHQRAHTSAAARTTTLATGTNSAV